eukprot:CAMPEP_0202902596 /NCGR_PEP_ID=MMETSP1392-20130828/16946_1 /ASSEMBLY_ACC=CAM_ASM_000868 /TAXON_ID=225041 /ORGANISM="Chlamydomonas chlamydogama, Strain SAG 11-48b" /LENGTH=112 /DNA_ID=CAMNT_0049589385 /DNA_START=289 /DNA_END=627 /DNA_ORIENTATION=+
MGPLKLLGSTAWPFCVISMRPSSASLLATLRVASISSRQAAGWVRRGASLGQHVLPGARLDRMCRIASSSSLSTASVIAMVGSAAHFAALACRARPPVITIGLLLGCSDGRV